MRKILITLVCSSLVATYSAFAQAQTNATDQTMNDNGQVSTDNQAGVSGEAQVQPPVITQNDHEQYGTSQNQQPGTAETTGVSTAQAPQPTVHKGLVDEKIGLKPQVGDLNYRDASGAISNRAVYGATLDFNIGEAVNKSANLPPYSGLYFGPSTGFFYSHIGAVGGNFFGSNSSGTTTSVANDQAGANMFYIPADLKAGWTIGNFRLSAHGGGNVIYRSAANTVQVGVNSPTSYTSSKWGILPNAGAALEYGVLNGGAIIVRPDWTFGGSNTMFSGTIGFSMPIG